MTACIFAQVGVDVCALSLFLVSRSNGGTLSSQICFFFANAMLQSHATVAIIWVSHLSRIEDIIKKEIIDENFVNAEIRKKPGLWI